MSQANGAFLNWLEETNEDSNHHYCKCFLEVIYKRKTLPEFLDTARVARGCGPMQIEKGGFAETFSYWSRKVSWKGLQANFEIFFW